MRQVVQWTENAKISIERGNVIKRWNRGNELLKEAKVEKWMKMKMSEIPSIECLDIEANKHLFKLLKDRNENDARQIKAQAKMKQIEEMEKDDRNTKEFISKAKIKSIKEKIEELEEEEEEEEGGNRKKKKKGKKEKREVKTVKDQEGMKRIAAEFYRKLWKKGNVSNRKRTEMMQKITRKLSEEEKTKCEGKIKKEEIAKIKMKMKKNKTAGIDGIPAEFWQKFAFLDEWLETVFEAAMQQKKMSHSMRIAVVKVIFKKKDRKKFENYRPLSMLCTDYKLLAKILTERMKGVLTSVIEKDQQGFIFNGDITGNLILVKEVIEYIEEEDLDGAIVMMDFMKAFDRIDRDVMFEVLERMNFGDMFVEYVKMMYNDVTAKIEINGELTEEVETTRGMRQGCPLSPLLFICVLELMAIEIRSNENWEGIKEPISEEEDKISLFADDSAGIFAKPNTQLKHGRESVEKYKKTTDSRLHDTKTKILPLGKTKANLLPNSRLQVEFEVMKNLDREKYLGDLLGHGISEKERFKAGIEQMEETEKAWKKEKTTYFGRAVIFNNRFTVCRL